MDRQFVKQMSGSFFNDYDLRGTGIWETQADAVDEFSQYISQLMKQTSMEDMETYKELHEASRQRQYEVTYYLIEDYIRSEYPNIDVFKEDSINDDLESELFKIESATLGLTYVAGGAVASLIINRAMKIYRHRAVKTFGDALISADKFVKGIKNWSSKLSAGSRVRDAIVYSNLERCGKYCKVTDIHDLSPDSNSAEAQKQYHCLLKCWLNFNQHVGKTIYNQYVVCTGQKLSRELSVYINPPEHIVGQCHVIYDKMIEHFNKFKDVVDALPGATDAEKHLILLSYVKGNDAVRTIPYLKR